jgi:UDPglucose--hexose-1-phosphate uridylyltransferase
MGEIRQNRITREWVIFAPERGKRPHQPGEAQGSKAQRPRRREDCPFCPGNEDNLTVILHRMPGPEAGEDSWQIRVIPNKYPTLTADQEPRRRAEELSIRMPGYGRQEVIVEHPRHDLDPSGMSDGEVARLVDAYQLRYRAAMEDRNVNMVLIFRNHGSKAGTSLRHPHSQLIASNVVPAHIRKREWIAQEYYDERGNCLLCDLLAAEREERVRLISETPDFTAFVPFAAGVPFEVWIVPRTHRAGFASVTAGEREGLAEILRQMLKRLKAGLDDPDYNYIINSAVRYKAEEPHLHWWLQIRPRLVTPAGFEIGSGMLINPTLPEKNARILRGSRWD